MNPDLREAPSRERVILLHGLWMRRPALWPLARRLRASGFDVDLFPYATLWAEPGQSLARLLNLTDGLLGQAPEHREKLVTQLDATVKPDHTARPDIDEQLRRYGFCIVGAGVKPAASRNLWPGSFVRRFGHVPVCTKTPPTCG